MDVVLLTLTTLSLAAAAGFGALSWRLGREERERARARIAALSSAMTPSSPPSSDTPLLAGVAVGSVFDRASEGLRGRPVIKIAAGAVMALTIVIGALIGASWDRSRDARGPGVADPPAPLELLSMRYQRQGDALTVSGLVRNPARGAAVNGVTAVVFAFDHSGSFVASGRAALDFSALAPGDESPFAVTVPNVSDVGRYRVSFRTGRGVVRHIDRRGDQVQLAQAVR